MNTDSAAPLSDEELAAKARILVAGKTLLPDFGGGPDTLKRYNRAYNGWGLSWIVRLIAGANLSKPRVENLLAVILEDALIATASHLGVAESGLVVIPTQGDSLIMTAIAERIPRLLDNKAKRAFARLLVDDLLTALGSTRMLSVDGGVVFWDEGHLMHLEVEFESVDENLLSGEEPA